MARRRRSRFGQRPGLGAFGATFEDLRACVIASAFQTERGVNESFVMVWIEIQRLAIIGEGFGIVRRVLHEAEQIIRFGGIAVACEVSVTGGGGLIELPGVGELAREFQRGDLMIRDGAGRNFDSGRHPPEVCSPPAARAATGMDLSLSPERPVRRRFRRWFCGRQTRAAAWRW